MFTADGSSRIRTGFQNFGRYFKDPSALVFIPFVEHNEGVEIAVAGVKYITDGKIVLLADCNHLTQDLGELCSRNRSIAASSPSNEPLERARGI